MSTLYRDYRPKNFKETVNQNHVKITLQNQIQTGNIANAYLFCGPRGIGKTTFARVFAKSLNCTVRKEGEYEPCNQCANCLETNAGASMDLIEIDAASHTGVDNVRENIIANARVTPVKCKYKVFIIDEVHMLSTSAFNALLKIIEEPPANVIFILATTEAHKVPATIISRCQRFDFKRISVNDISQKLIYIAKLEKIEIDQKIIESIARQSEGHMRDAESVLGQIMAIGGKTITQEEADLVIPRSNLSEIIILLEHLSKKDAASSIKLVNSLLDNGVDFKNFFNELIEVLRKILLNKINPGLTGQLGIEYGESYDLKIAEAVKDIDLPTIISYIEKFSEARNRIKDSYILQLPLELAIADICLPKANPVVLTKTASSNQPVTENRAEIKTIKSNLGNSNISQADIKGKWGELLVKIKQYNHSLSFILRVCEPRDINGNELCLAFKYKFHKDRINDIQTKNLVEKVISEVYGADIIIKPIIDEELEVNSNSLVSSEPISLEKKTEDAIESVQPAPSENNDTINNILKTFGGRIVK